MNMLLKISEQGNSQLTSLEPETAYGDFSDIGVKAYNSAGCVTNIGYSGAGFSQNIGLSWNSQYQLTAVTTNGVLAEQNSFDALGRRVWTSDGTTNYYMVYDGAHVLAEVNSIGGLLRAYTHGPGIDNWLAMTVYTGTTVKSYFYLTDHLGSVHAVADETGSIVESYRFDAWGRVLGVYDANNNPLTESAIGNRILWQGREYSWKTGLYFFRARWYDPITGRWLSNDPIGISGGLNQYEFCGSNPINFVDPYGLNGFWRGLGDVVGKIWNLPNTLIGLVWGGAGIPFGAHVSIDNNAVQFLDHPFMANKGAITLGNTTSYGDDVCPKTELPNGTFATHEKPHTIQGQWLGPLYLPANLIGGAAGLIFNGSWHGPANFMERGPQASPPHP